MAISKGRSTESANSFNQYTGVDQFKVLGVNPTLETLNSWGVNLKDQPEYTSIGDDGVKACRIQFWVQSVSIPEFITRLEFRLTNKKNETVKDGVHKTQMIDAYGNAAWLTDEEVKLKKCPVQKNGKPARFIPDNMRPCRPGEAALTEFIKFFINIDDSHRYIDKEWKPIDNLKKAECQLTGVGKYFAGDFSELSEIMTYQPENTVQLLCGIRSGKDGRIYQEVYADKCFRKGSNGVGEKFSEEIADRKAKGGLKGTEFTFGSLKVWSVTPSTKKEADEAVDDSPSTEA